MTVAERPPAYLSCASLAHELDVSETTVHEMVRRGVLPPPIKMSAGCVRWCWADVQLALASLSGSNLPEANTDPFLKGVRNVQATQ
jgi:predicted DNA-binding transcriptional regulator AlpA